MTRSSLTFPRVAVALALLLGLASCGATVGNSTGPDQVFFTAPINQSAADIRTWRVRRISVHVAPTLTVSTDPELRFPGTDIVWWGEPDGDRRAQVARIMEAGLRSGVGWLDGARAVDLRAELVHFHALTPKARSSGFLGWHDIAYRVVVVDARTGADLARSELINADVRALQGAVADKAEAKGETQATRITANVGRSIAAWLSSGQN